MANSWAGTEEALTLLENRNWFEDSFGESPDKIYGNLLKKCRCFNTPLEPYMSAQDIMKTAIAKDQPLREAEVTFQLILTKLVFPEIPIDTDNDTTPHLVTSHDEDLKMDFGFGFGDTSQNRRYRIVGELKVPREEGHSPYEANDRKEIWMRGLVQLGIYIGRCFEKGKVCNDQYVIGWLGTLHTTTLLVVKGQLTPTEVFCTIESRWMFAHPILGTQSDQWVGELKELVMMCLQGTSLMTRSLVSRHSE